MENTGMDVSDKDAINMTYWFTFEKTFDVKAVENYMKQHWTDSFIYSVVYVIVIFSLKFYMTDRKRYDLRLYLSIWSGALAVFSIIGTLRTLPELIWGFTNHGFEYIYCNSSYLDQGKVSTVWNILFVLSKAVELGDTVFIVLRKQKLIFLHWYHHITVLIYCWYTYPDRIASARNFIITNYCVHSVMYTYYALRAMQFRFPKQVNMLITFLQLVQMIWGLIIIMLSYVAYSSGRHCATHYWNITFGVLLYFSYLILFSHFFYKTYIVKGQVTHEKKH